MPLIMAKATMAQAAIRQPVMTGLNSPDSSMESVMSRALRNQKYVVGELPAHSFAVGKSVVVGMDVFVMTANNIHSKNNNWNNLTGNK